MSEAFERQLASYLDVRYAVCVSSGTAALHLGLLALGIGRGDEVIVPAFGHPAGANAVELCGARVIFVDSGADDFNIDTRIIENSITANTRAVMVVHNFGRPCEMNPVQALSAKYGLPIIEDAACALGSSIGRARCGNLGCLAALSFHPGEILTTGEGGAVVTDDPFLAERVRELRNHGLVSGKTVEFLIPGFNYRMGEIQAAMGVSQMKRFRATLGARIRAAENYDRALSKIEYMSTRFEKAIRKTNYQTYVTLVKDGLRDRLAAFLGEKGIEAGIRTYSVPHTAYYSEKYRYGVFDFPNSLNYRRNLIGLPLFDGISLHEQEEVTAALHDFGSGMKCKPATELWVEQAS